MVSFTRCLITWTNRRYTIAYTVYEDKYRNVVLSVNIIGAERLVLDLFIDPTFSGLRVYVRPRIGTFVPDARVETVCRTRTVTVALQL